MRFRTTVMRAMLASVVLLTATGMAMAQGSGASPKGAYGMHCWGPHLGAQGWSGHPMMGSGQDYGMMGPGYDMGPGHNGYGRGYGPGYGSGQGYGPGYGPGPGYGSGPGYGPGYGPAPGYGMGPGLGGGPGMMQPPGDPLSTDDVRLMMEHRLAWQGNPNIKIGEIEEADDSRITAEIVTQDGSLVQKLEIDRQTGFMRQVE